MRAELLAARLLLGDRRMDLAFEAYGSGRGGPNFTVTFRSSRTFNLEVTRLRRTPDRSDYSEPILAKLRQLPPTVPNALVVALDGEAAGALDAGAAVRALRARADAKDEAFFTAARVHRQPRLLRSPAPARRGHRVGRAGDWRRAGDAVGERIGPDRAPGALAGGLPGGLSRRPLSAA